MKLIRRRKPSLKTALGITKAKRNMAKATGIPTTKSDRKRKAMNTLTGGAYGKYQRTRAAINRPLKYAKHPPTLMGCLISLMMLIQLPIIFITMIIGMLSCGCLMKSGMTPIVCRMWRMAFSF